MANVAERDATLGRNMVAYLPEFRRKLFSAWPQAVGTAGEEFGAALLFADVSGFTALTEAMSEIGPRGTEELRELLDARLGTILDIVAEQGGDVAYHAGDALWVLWPTEPGAKETLTRAAMRAVQSALSIQAAASAPLARRGPRLSLRTSVAVGSMRYLEIGGADGRWLPLLLGSPFEQIGSVDHEAAPGEVAVSPQVWSLIHPYCLAKTQTASGVTVLDRVEKPLAPDFPGPAALLVPDPILLRSAVPSIICQRIEEGLEDRFSEFRWVTVAFAGFGCIDHRDTERLATLHRLVAKIQSTINHLNGEIYQFLGDDKGLSLVFAFGLPLASHQDDAARALRAALEICTLAGAAGMPLNVGLASGTVFCGVLGSEKRRELTLVGPPMNRAARIMQAGLGVVCDGATYEAAGGARGLVFRPSPALVLKGLSAPVPVYLPALTAVHEPRFAEVGSGRGGATESSIPPPGSDSEGGYDAPLSGEFDRVGAWQRKGDGHPVLGRERERAMLVELMEKLVHQGKGSLVLLEGDAGIGKTTLLEDLSLTAIDKGIGGALARCDELGRGSSYSAWRAIFSSLFDLHIASEGVRAEARNSQGRLGSDEEWTLLLTLLSREHGLRVAPTQGMADMTAEARRDSTNRLMLELLRWRALQSPILLIFDDTQWLDPSSWAMITMVAQRLPSVLMVVASRPQRPLPECWNTLLTQGAQPLLLGPLEATCVDDLVQQLFGSRQVPRSITGLVRERSNGNPFLALGIAALLRDYGLVRVDAGVVRVCVGGMQVSAALEETLRSRGLPFTVQGVVTSRLERLPLAFRAVLHAASVVGRRFSCDLVRVAAPDLVRIPLLPTLRELERLGLIEHDEAFSEDAGCFRFRHDLILEAIYCSLSFAVRREMHGLLAEHLEANGELAGPAPSATLAHHFFRAEILPKALTHLTAAGKSAVEIYANQEAVTHLEAALQIQQSLPREPSGLTHGELSLRLLLGKAYLGLSQYGQAKSHLEAALQAMGHPIPATPGKLWFGLLRELATQVGHRWWPGAVRGDFTAESQPINLSASSEGLLRAARTTESLVEIYFYVNDGPRSLYCALATLNLAERGAGSTEMARGFAIVGAIFGFVPLHGLARTYATRSLHALARCTDLSARCWVSVVVAVSRAGVGDWLSARELFVQARADAARIGDQRRWQDAVGDLAYVDVIQGRFIEALGILDAHESAIQKGDDRYVSGTLRTIAYTCLELDRLEQVDEIVSQLNALVVGGLPAEELAARVDLHAMSAALAWARGNREQAYIEAKAGTTLLLQVKSSTSFFPAFVGYAHLAEVLLALLEVETKIHSAKVGQGKGTSVGTSVQRIEDLGRLAEIACHALRNHAKVFPIALPRSLLCSGTLLWLRGHKGRARRMWLRAEAQARRLDMPFELVLLQCERERRSENVPVENQPTDGIQQRLLQLGASRRARLNRERAQLQ